MRLIKINGNIWDLSCLQKGYSNIRKVTVDDANYRIIHGQDPSDVTRVISNFGVRSNATAIIEVMFNKLPCQVEYVIYLNNNGFFCNVRGKRIFLKDIMEAQHYE